MPKIIEPLVIEIEHLDGVSFACTTYRVGSGAPRVRIGTGISTKEAVSELLKALRRAGHAGKRFETMGLQPLFRGSVPGWRKRAPRAINTELGLEVRADGNR